MAEEESTALGMKPTGVKSLVTTLRQDGAATRFGSGLCSFFLASSSVLKIGQRFSGPLLTTNNLRSLQKIRALHVSFFLHCRSEKRKLRREGTR
jgi:hypothetical protein